MDFQQQLIITLVDKLAIGLLLLLGALWVNHVIERYKSKKALENEMAKLRDEKRLEFLERQLSEFYWPFYIRLEKDRSIWRRILDINKEEGRLDQKLGVEIEKNVILPNHKAMIQLIETRVHLAQPDGDLTAKLMRYVKQATEYLALREAGDTTHFSINEIGTDWLHQELFEEIKRITRSLQSQYEVSVKEAVHKGA